MSDVAERIIFSTWGQELCVSMWWPEPSQLRHCGPRVASGDSCGVPMGGSARLHRPGVPQLCPFTVPRDALLDLSAWFQQGLHCWISPFPSSSSSPWSLQIPGQSLQLELNIARAILPCAWLPTDTSPCQRCLQITKKLSASQALSRLFLLNLVSNLNLNLLFKP